MSNWEQESTIGERVAESRIFLDYTMDEIQDMTQPNLEDAVNLSINHLHAYIRNYINEVMITSGGQLFDSSNSEHIISYFSAINNGNLQGLKSFMRERSEIALIAFDVTNDQNIKKFSQNAAALSDFLPEEIDPKVKVNILSDSKFHTSD